MSALLEAPETRCAKSLSNRIQEIAADLSDEREQEYCTNVEALVIDCGSLARQWRAAVSRFSTAMNCRHEINYQELGSQLGSAVRESLQLYYDVQDLAEQSGCGVPNSHLADLTLATIEATNIQRWLDTWPRYDQDRHDTARAAIADGDFCSDDDIASWTPR